MADNSGGGISKLLLIGLIAVGGYLYLGSGNGASGIVVTPVLSKTLQKYDIDELYQFFCKGETRPRATCQCLVIPLHREIHAQYNGRELDRLKREGKSIYGKAIARSYNGMAKETEQCISDRGVRVKDLVSNLVKQMKHRGGEL